jgi:hypothetical protein
MEFINLVIEDKLNMGILALIIIHYFLKTIISSPKETLNIIEDLTKKKISDLDELLKLPSLHPDDKKKLKQEQRKLVFRKLTGIRDANKVLPLFNIIKKQDLPIKYFEKSNQYIHSKEGRVILDTGWTFWLFDWLFTRLLSMMVIFQSTFIIIYYIFSQEIKPHILLSLLITLSSCILFGVYIWKTSLTKSKINNIKLVLERSHRNN